MEDLEIFDKSGKALHIADVMKRINDLKDEYDRIRNYEYDKYEDEWEAMDRKRLCTAFVGTKREDWRIISFYFDEIWGDSNP